MSTNKIEVATKPLNLKNIILIIIGSMIYALAVTLFLQPLNLLAGGVPGTAQVIRGIFFQGTYAFDPLGVINFLINVPLFILAYTGMKKKMIIGTAISIVVQTIIFSIVQVPAVPILDDKLACIVVSGLSAGFGCGVVLSNGGTCGGLDLLGLYLTKKLKNFSVGKMNLMYNVVLYLYCSIQFGIEACIYSILFVLFCSFAVDRFHYQNIAVELMIFTHHSELAQLILSKYVRGVTEWEGQGAYTKKDTHVLVTIVAKNEVEQVKKDILEMDPSAFVIVHDQVSVLGGYQKRLDN